MKKQRNLIISLSFFLVLLLAILVVAKKANEKKETEVSPDRDMIDVCELSEDDITAFSYTYDGNEYAFEKENGKWYVLGDHTKNVTQYKISDILYKVTPLKASREITSVTDFAQYDLGDTARAIVISTADQTYKFLVGSLNELTGSYYVKMDTSDTVYIVPEDNITVFDVTSDDVIEEEETETEETEIENIETEEIETENTVVESETAESN